jgi:hypothetical protein
MSDYIAQTEFFSAEPQFDPDYNFDPTLLQKGADSAEADDLSNNENEPYHTRSPSGTFERTSLAKSPSQHAQLTEQDLNNVYVYVDQVPVDRIKRNLNRDFSDASLMGELIKFNLVQSHKGIIDVHNYP